MWSLGYYDDEMSLMYFCLAGSKSSVNKLPLNHQWVIDLLETETVTKDTASIATEYKSYPVQLYSLDSAAFRRDSDGRIPLVGSRISSLEVA